MKAALDGPQTAPGGMTEKAALEHSSKSTKYELESSYDDQLRAAIIPQYF